MKYFAIHNDAIQIENSDVSEVTITLHTFKPKITIKNPSYISGVYNDNGDSVTKLPVIYVDGYDSTSTGYATIHSDLASVCKIYAAADTIDIKVLGAQDTSSKIRVFAVMCDISGVDETDRN